MKPWLRRRGTLSLYDIILIEVKFEDEEEYKKFLKMAPGTFDDLLWLITKRWYVKTKLGMSDYK